KGPGSPGAGAFDRHESGVARELLAQSGELRVAGERPACRLLGARTVRRRRRRAGGLLGLGSSELLHLRSVHLVAALGLGVPRLPLVTLLLEAFEPLVGVGV